MTDSPFKLWRNAKKLTQVELGGCLGVDGITVSRWERGDHMPKKSLWPKIEEVTGITPSQMIGHVKSSEAAQ